MRKTLLILASLASLAGCGKSSYQSLPHALAALQAGDYDDFLTAKRESDEQVKKALQPGGDLCLASAGDFYTYQAQFALSRLDDRALFKLPEDDRFVYAMKIAGRDPGLEPGNFLEQAPIRRMTAGETELGKTGCEK
jgi:hypothetical protein